MKSTISYNRPASLATLHTQVKQSFLHFIDQHPEVFTALSRQSTPHGDNLFRGVLAPEHSDTETAPASLESIRQQLDSLNGQVARLNHDLKSTESTKAFAPVPATQIGIHRFRALRARLHASA